MIKSMTAFSRVDQNTPWGHLSWEVRSVNHRYLEISFKLPEELRYLEPRLRDITKGRIARGKLEVVAKLNKSESFKELPAINGPLISHLIKAAEHVRQLTKHASEINPTDILSWPNALTSPIFTPNEQVEDEAQSLFREVIEQLFQGRTQEGQALSKFIANKNSEIQRNIQAIQNHLPIIANNQRDKLSSKLNELQINIDKERLEQELLYLFQKSDINEEIERLETHSQALFDIIKLEEPVGRRLDFLLQEINREINTIGSKLPDIVISPIVVDLKVLTEQLREQIQNIE